MSAVFEVLHPQRCIPHLRRSSLLLGLLSWVRVVCQERLMPSIGPTKDRGNRIPGSTGQDWKRGNVSERLGLDGTYRVVGERWLPHYVSQPDEWCDRTQSSSCPE